MISNVYRLLLVALLAAKTCHAEVKTDDETVISDNRVAIKGQQDSTFTSANRACRVTHKGRLIEILNQIDKDNVIEAYASSLIGPIWIGATLTDACAQEVFDQTLIRFRKDCWQWTNKGVPLLDFPGLRWASGIEDKLISQSTKLVARVTPQDIGIELANDQNALRPFLCERVDELPVPPPCQCPPEHKSCKC